MAKRKPKPRSKYPKVLGRSDYNAPLPEEVDAAIWALTEEGLSQRAVAEQLGIGPSKVGHALVKDPIRLDELRARQREHRAQRWKGIEDVGLGETLAWLEAVKKIRLAGWDKASKKTLAKLALIPRIIQAVRHTAETATRATQLLTGGATSRVERTGVSDDLDTPEGVIRAAIEVGLAITDIPPALRPRARVIMLELQGQPSAEGSAEGSADARGGLPCLLQVDLVGADGGQGRAGGP